MLAPYGTSLTYEEEHYHCSLLVSAPVVVDGRRVVAVVRSLMISRKEDLLPMREERKMKRRFLPRGVSPDNVIWLCNIQRVPEEKVC